jgi:hypothetical protein
MTLDKITHGLAGSLCAFIASSLAMAMLGLQYAKGWDFFGAWAVGVLAAMLIGWAKEKYDRQGYGTYDPRDANVTAAGGIVGATINVALMFWLGWGLA